MGVVFTTHNLLQHQSAAIATPRLSPTIEEEDQQTAKTQCNIDTHPRSSLPTLNSLNQRMEKLGHQRLTCLLVAWLTLLVQIFFIHAADCSQHNGLYRSSENINQQILFDIDPFGQHLGIGSEDLTFPLPTCKTADLSTHVSERREKNLFLQSLYKEEQEKSYMTNDNNNGKHAFHSDIQDKDIVEALENEVQY
ncbi:hypothetical protein CsSME_00037036 [Camellia sinensis var. sinensis]